MKNLLLLLITTFVLYSCSKKDDEQPTSEIDKLPIATQTGANTAGCLIDGKAYVPKGLFPSGNPTCRYDGEDFALGIGELTGSTGDVRDVVVISNNQNLHDNIGKVFELNNYASESKYGEFTIYTNLNSNIYQTNSNIKGEFKITYHNYDKAILSKYSREKTYFILFDSSGNQIRNWDGRARSTNATTVLSSPHQ